MLSMWQIGDRIRERREKSEISAKDAAENLGISKSYLSMLETGKSKPNWELLGEIASLYQVSADYLLGLIDDPAGRRTTLG